MEETPSSRYISPGLQRIAELARKNPQWAFTTLAHHIDLELRFLKHLACPDRTGAAK